MKLKDYDLVNWTGKIRRQKKLENNRILLLSVKGMPPEAGERNLIAVDEDENILWVADLPKMGGMYGSYQEMRYHKEKEIIEAWCGSTLCEIDPNSGKVLNERFVW